MEQFQSPLPSGAGGTKRARDSRTRERNNTAVKRHAPARAAANAVAAGGSVPPSETFPKGMAVELYHCQQKRWQRGFISARRQLEEGNS